MEPNYKMIAKGAQFLQKAFAFLFFAAMMWLMLCYVVFNSMVVFICGAVITVGVAVGGVWLVQKGEQLSVRHFRVILICGLCAFFLVSFFAGESMKIGLPSDTDIVYDAVADLLDDGVLNRENLKFDAYYPNLGMVTNADYFYRCYNNILLLLLLAGAYFLGAPFGAVAGTVEGQWLAIGVSALCVTLSILFICLIVKNMFDSNVLGLLAGLFCISFTPFYYSIPNFYTDIIVLPFLLSAVYCFLRLQQRQSRKWAGVAGLLFSIAVMMKITAAIVLIATVIYMMLDGLKRQKGKQSLLLAAILCGCFFICTSVFQLWYTNSPMFSFSTQEEPRLPMQTWIAFGSHGDGSYSYEDMAAIVAAKTLQEKTQVANEIIRSNYSKLSAKEFFSFMTHKLAYTWNDAQFDSTIYAKWPLEANWSAYFTQDNQWGYIVLYWYSKCYLFVLYAFTGVMALRCLLEKHPTINWYANVCIFGTISYLLIFETSPRRALIAVPFLICNTVGVLSWLAHIKRSKKMQGIT